MANVVVRYRPKADRADENQRLVEAVFEEAAATGLEDVRYATFRLADGTFLHVHLSDQDDSPLATLDAWADFQDGIVERCVAGEAPEVQPANIVGNHHLL